MDTKIVYDHGYEFTLIKGAPRKAYRCNNHLIKTPKPNFMGYKGYALKSCRKLNTFLEI